MDTKSTEFTGSKKDKVDNNSKIIKLLASINYEDKIMGLAFIKANSHLLENQEIMSILWSAMPMHYIISTFGEIENFKSMEEFKSEIGKRCIHDKKIQI